MRPAQLLSTQALHPAWVPDSLLNWCEFDYEVTWLIAEFFNTISNFWYMAFAVFGIYNAFRYHYETRFILAHVALFVVGFGSALFHGTLTYNAQLLDEVPMLFVAAIILYCCVSLQSPRPPRWVPWTLLAYVLVTSANYIYSREAEDFQNAFSAEGLMIGALIVLNRKYFSAAPVAVVNDRVDEGFSETAADGVDGGAEEDEQRAYTPDQWSRELASRTPIVGTVRVISDRDAGKLLRMVIGSFAAALAVWVIDNLACESLLIPVKLSLGYPLRVLFEFHGWWHFFSGVHTYA
ncbi:ceramidase [Blastocladiella britannica]|nr:ceramidase [Blastocladiella britannica]